MPTFGRWVSIYIYIIYNKWYNLGVACKRLITLFNMFSISNLHAPLSKSSISRLEQNTMIITWLFSCIILLVWNGRRKNTNYMLLLYPPSRVPDVPTRLFFSSSPSVSKKCSKNLHRVFLSPHRRRCFCGGEPIFLCVRVSFVCVRLCYWIVRLVKKRL